MKNDTALTTAELAETRYAVFDMIGRAFRTRNFCRTGAPELWSGRRDNLRALIRAHRKLEQMHLCAICERAAA